MGTNHLVIIDAQNDFCQKCHNTENDQRWDHAERWKHIAHPTPANALLPANNPAPPAEPVAEPVPLGIKILPRVEK